MNHLTDKRIMWFALGMWQNHIQTGDVTLTKADARAMGKPFKEVWDLEQSQNDLANRLENMRQELIK